MSKSACTCQPSSVGSTLAERTAIPSAAAKGASDTNATMKTARNNEKKRARPRVTGKSEERSVARLMVLDRGTAKKRAVRRTQFTTSLKDLPAVSRRGPLQRPEALPGGSRQPPADGLLDAEFQGLRALPRRTR